MKKIIFLITLFLSYEVFAQVEYHIDRPIMEEVLYIAVHNDVRKLLLEDIDEKAEIADLDMRAIEGQMNLLPLKKQVINCLVKEKAYFSKKPEVAEKISKCGQIIADVYIKQSKNKYNFSIDREFVCAFMMQNTENMLTEKLTQEEGKFIAMGAIDIAKSRQNHSQMWDNFLKCLKKEGLDSKEKCRVSSKCTIQYEAVLEKEARKIIPLLKQSPFFQQ